MPKKKRAIISVSGLAAAAALLIPFVGCQTQSAYRNAMFQAAMQHEYRQLEYDYDMIYTQLLQSEEENDYLRAQLEGERDDSPVRTSRGNSGSSLSPELLDDAPAFDSDDPRKLPSDRIPDFLNIDNPQSRTTSPARRPYTPGTRTSETQPPVAGRYTAPTARETSPIERQREMPYYPPVSSELYEGFENAANTGNIASENHPADDGNPLIWSP